MQPRSGLAAYLHDLPKMLIVHYIIIVVLQLFAKSMETRVTTPVYLFLFFIFIIIKGLASTKHAHCFAVWTVLISAKL